MRILITGICGFVGSTLAEHLLISEPGLTVFGMDNLSRPGSERNRCRLQTLGIKFFHGDMRAPSDFELLPTVDWVVDAAANPSVRAGIDGQTSSRQLVEHNLSGTVNLLEYCKRISAGLILLSTNRVYSIGSLSQISVQASGETFKLLPGQDFPKGLSYAGVSERFSTLPPLSLYGSTKLSSETLALEYGAAFDFPVWINRCGNLAGAGQFGRADQGILSFWINSWRWHKPLSYIGFGGTGYQVRDFLHPRDLVLLIRKQMAAEEEPSTRIFNLGGGLTNSISLAELSNWCRECFGEHSVNSQPQTHRYDVPWLVMDSSVAHAFWDWSPVTTLPTIFDEIARHGNKNPDWLALSGAV